MYISRLKLVNFEGIRQGLDKREVEINFDVEKKITMLSGGNGSGKSTILSQLQPYKESFDCISGAIRRMVKNGIDVRLYNFPICTVQKSFWTLCEKSISGNKVRFGEVCDVCKYRSACGGVFAGTFPLEKDELKAIL